MHVFAPLDKNSHVRAKFRADKNKDFHWNTRLQIFLSGLQKNYVEVKRIRECVGYIYESLFLHIVL